MKKFLAMAVAATALSVAMPAAAQSWQSINQRQANLDLRIDMGVRNGSLTRGEAAQLRAEFRQIAMIENQYRRNGLTQAERRDLDRRFDALSSRVRFERHDNNDRGWQSINQRQRELDNRIDAGVRSGRLSRGEAAELRTQFRRIASLEDNYRRSNGLSQAERRDLDRRFDQLNLAIQAEMNDRGRGRG